MSSISSRYHSAVHAKSLRPDSHKGDIGTQYTDTDTLAAFGRAAAHLERGTDAKGRMIRPAPLAVPLERLLAGGAGSGAANAVVAVMAQMLFEQSWTLRVKLTRVEAGDMARMCLAWHRDGICRPCDGLGWEKIPGTPTLSHHECKVCHGTRKIPFENQFVDRLVPLARWLLVEMEVASGRAGQAAMRALAPTLDL